ncbi:MAG: hypothetical protein ABW101_07395 [Candidatus Thiodiazotropha sp.]
MLVQKLITRAAEFLSQHGVEFVDSPKIGREEDGRIEVIFPIPETLDPDVAFVDPEDVRVWVAVVGDVVELIHQM